MLPGSRLVGTARRSSSVGSSSHNRWRSNFGDPRDGFVDRRGAAGRTCSRDGTFTPKRAAGVCGQGGGEHTANSSLFFSQLTVHAALRCIGERPSANQSSRRHDRARRSSTGPEASPGRQPSECHRCGSTLILARDCPIRITLHPVAVRDARWQPADLARPCHADGAA